MKKLTLTFAALAMLSGSALADCVPLTANYVGAPALQCVGDDGGNGQPVFGLREKIAKDKAMEEHSSK